MTENYRPTEEDLKRLDEAQRRLEALSNTPTRYSDKISDRLNRAIDQRERELKRGDYP